MSEEVYAALDVASTVRERMFDILFAKSQELGYCCPPREFQPDPDDPRGCRTPSLATDDTCLECWRNYAKIQALLDLGIFERVERAMATYADACKYEEEKKRDA